MAREMTTYDYSHNQKRLWDKNEEALNWLLSEITKDKGKRVAEGLKKELYDSYTYMLLCDLGAMAPSKEVLLNLWESERMEGFFGFLEVTAKLYRDIIED